jgi:transposase
MKEKIRKVFSKEFKLEAVRLLAEGRKPAAEIARELGIRSNQLYKWKEKIDKYGGEVFPGTGQRYLGVREEQDVTRLRRELAKVKEENEILKKAAAFFARELK